MNKGRYGIAKLNENFPRHVALHVHAAAEDGWRVKIHQASSDTCALMRSLEVAVVVIELIVPTDVSDSFEPERDSRAFREEGDSVTFAIGTNIPYLSGQSKYLRYKKSRYRLY